MDRYEMGHHRLELIQGDITEQSLDAIANAANIRLSGGGGVDGAIHRAGGPSILAECRKIGGCPTGQAVLTGAGNLPCDSVIHTVGPVYRDGKHGEPALLAACYRNSLALAAQEGVRSIAFPSISTGVYGYPLSQAAPIALQAAVDHFSEHANPSLVRFVLFDATTYNAYAEALAALESLR